jgi:hypothetical protein
LVPTTRRPGLLRCLLRSQQKTLATISQKQGEPATTDTLEGVTQKTVSHKIDLACHGLLSLQLNREAGEREVARLASLGLAHVGD